MVPLASGMDDSLDLKNGNATTDVQDEADCQSPGTLLLRGLAIQAVLGVLVLSANRFEASVYLLNHTFSGFQ
jgi:hypothetical protein